MVCYKLQELLFGNNKDWNKQLFYLLQRAYVEARYRSDYNVNSFELAAMEEMVKRLYGLLREINNVGPVHTMEETIST